MLKEAARQPSNRWQCRHRCTDATTLESLIPQVFCNPLCVAD